MRELRIGRMESGWLVELYGNIYVEQYPGISICFNDFSSK